MGSFRDTLRGSLRINGNQHAFRYVLWHKLERFIHDYPEVELELGNDTRFVDIVAERFDGAIICIIPIGDIIRLCCKRWWRI